MPTPHTRFLGDRVGSWRSQLLWRGLGAAIVVGSLHEYYWPHQQTFRSVPLSWSAFRDYVQARPVAEHAFTAAGIALLLFGGRVVTVACLGVASAWYLWASTTQAGLFPAAELPIFALLPPLACVAYLLERRRSGSQDPTRPDRIDETVVALVRITMVTSMAFAVLHKINADFFDPETSCVREFSGWIAEAWGGPGELLRSVASPLVVVLTEASILLALLAWPHLGIVLASSFFLLLGLVGASRINVLMIVMTWSFLRDDDLPILQRHRRRIAAVVAVVTTIAIGVSLAIYRVRVLPREIIALLELVAIASGVAALSILLERRRAQPSTAPGGAQPADASARDVRPNRLLVSLAAMLLIVNAAAPYLGLKYNYSFAMWSNLRADESRWNSWIVPSRLQLRGVRDRYVDVTRVELIKPRVTFLPARAVPVERFVESVEALRRLAPVELSLAIRYRGEEHSFSGGLDDEALRAVLEQMKSDVATGARRGEPPDSRPVLVRQAVAEGEAPYDPPYEQRLEPALFSPAKFRRLVDGLRRGGWNMDIGYRYGGERRDVTAAMQDREFLRWVESLSGNNLFPDKLDGAGTQRCIH